jgi:uncharacterized repeat protein (TIGR01451 family)
MKRSKTLLLTCVAVLMAAGLLDGAEAKSLYVIADINASPTPIHAYDIQGNRLVFQAAYTIPSIAGGAVGITIDTISSTLFVTYEGSNTIQLVDAVHFTPLQSIEAPGADNLAGIVVDQKKQKVYAVDRRRMVVYAYSWDGSTRELTLEPNMPVTLANVSLAYGIALDESRGLLYVGDATDTVRYFDTATWAYVGGLTVTQPAIGVAVDSAGGFLYTGNSYSGLGSRNVMCQVDLRSGAVRDVSVGEGNDVLGIAVDKDTGLVYATTGDEFGRGSDEVLVFDTGLNKRYSTGDIGNPTGLCVPDSEIGFNPFNLTKGDGLNNAQSVSPGDEITYELCYDNASNDIDGVNVSLADTLPADTAFVSATGAATQEQDLVTWSLGTLPAGSSMQCQEVTVRVKATATPGSVLHNSCTISGYLGDRVARTTKSADTKVTDKVAHSFKGDVNGNGELDVLDYHLFGVPIQTVKSQDILTPQTSGTSMWAFGYDTGKDLDPDNGTYKKQTDVAPLGAGAGYWLIGMQDRNFTVEGTPVLPVTGSVFVVKTYPGPNIVGCPFPLETRWGDVRVRPLGSNEEVPIWSSTTVEHVAYGYDQGYFAVDIESGTLMPWQAYWIKNTSEAVMELLFPVPPTGDGIEADAFRKSIIERSVPLRASASRQSASQIVDRGPKGISFVLSDNLTGYRDRTLFLGFDPRASTGPDAMDSTAPPMISEQLPRIYVAHRNWKVRPGLYAADVRRLGNLPARFTVTVRVPSKPRVTSYSLGWTGLDQVAPNRRVRLMDSETNRTINMRKRNHCTLEVPRNRASYSFDVVVSK